MQNFIVLLIVASAFAYLAWRGWSLAVARKKSAGCGSCGSCPSNDTAGAKVTPLVTIQPLAGSKSKAGD
jgi:hypothetical protein